jgi:hypothetical protein
MLFYVFMTELCLVWNASDVMSSCPLVSVCIPLLEKNSCCTSKLYKNLVQIKTSYICRVVRHKIL